MKLLSKIKAKKKYIKKGKTYLSFLFLFSYILAIFFLFFYNNFHFFSVKSDKSLAILEVEAKEIEKSTTTISEIPKKVLNMNFSLEKNPSTIVNPVWPTDGCGYISNNYSGYHDGIDIAGCPYNANIYATMGGTVITVSTKYDNGLYIVIQHDNGQYTMYAHLASSYVSVGQRVEASQVIGGMGRSGNATGVHLHFSLWTAYPYLGASLSPWFLY